MRPLLALIAILGFSTPAFATCPGVFAGLACNGGSTTDICTTSGAVSQVVCDLGYNGETRSPEATFVQPTDTSFLAYGYDGNGDAFCCPLVVSNGCTGQSITTTIYGTTHVDAINLYDAIANTDMTCGATYVYGGDQGDTIYGSKATTNVDWLFGDNGNDVIHAQEGSDIVRGGDHDDIIYGGHGDDYLYGGDGYDQVAGGPGNDYIFGDDGTGTGSNEKDDLRGNENIDHIYGGQYGDIICGDGELDLIYGLGGDDLIYGGAAAGDTIVGGADNDSCEEGDCDLLLETYCRLSF